MIQLQLLKRICFEADGTATGGGEAQAEQVQPEKEASVFNPDLFKDDPSFQKWQNDNKAKWSAQGATTRESSLSKTYEERIIAERAKWAEESKMSAEELATKRVKEQIEAGYPVNIEVI